MTQATFVPFAEYDATTRQPRLGQLTLESRRLTWTNCVAVAVTVGLIVAAALLDGRGIASLHVFVILLSAIPICFASAKVWYTAKHRQTVRVVPTAGLCVQGAVAGGTLWIVGLLVATHSDVGVTFDAITPAVFLTMSFGRIGCLCGGCCGGRPTTSRLGLWWFDGRLGVRRVPTQLIEAGACALIAVVTWRIGSAPTDGMLFAASVLGYAGFRQVVFALRAENPGFSRARATRLLVLALSAALLLLIGT